jgi:hypothetical protein
MNQVHRVGLPRGRWILLRGSPLLNSRRSVSESESWRGSNGPGRKGKGSGDRRAPLPFNPGEFRRAVDEMAGFDLSTEGRGL